MTGNSGPRPSDRFIPWYIVTFFAFQFVLFGWFYYVASSTYNGLVTDRAYEKGLQYNTVIAKAEAQEKLGWTSEIVLKDGRVHFSLHDRAGVPLQKADVQALLVRPVRAGMDFSVTLPDTAPGIYAAPVTVPAPGLWEVRVRAEHQGQVYQAMRRLEF